MSWTDAFAGLGGAFQGIGSMLADRAKMQMQERLEQLRDDYLTKIATGRNETAKDVASTRATATVDAAGARAAASKYATDKKAGADAAKLQEDWDKLQATLGNKTAIDAADNATKTKVAKIGAGSREKVATIGANARTTAATIGANASMTNARTSATARTTAADTAAAASRYRTDHAPAGAFGGLFAPAGASPVAAPAPKPPVSVVTPKAGYGDLSPVVTGQAPIPDGGGAAAPAAPAAKAQPDQVRAAIVSQLGDLTDQYKTATDPVVKQQLSGKIRGLLFQHDQLDPTIGPAAPPGTPAPAVPPGM